MVMYCWKCGQELTDGASACVYCGANQRRPEPASEAGRAMRQLYDRYGRDTLLTNNLMLVNGLGDLVENSQKLRNQMKMALDAGMGQLYLDQLNTTGAPDAAFDQRVKRMMTDDAGLSDKAAAEIAGLFDDMIGWRAASKVQSANAVQPQPAADTHEEIDRSTGRVYRKPEPEQKESAGRLENLTPLPLPNMPVPGKPKGIGFLIAAIITMIFPILGTIISKEFSVFPVLLFVGIASAFFIGYRRRAGKVDGSLLSLRRTEEGVVCKWQRSGPAIWSLAVNGQWIVRGASSPWVLYNVPSGSEIVLAEQTDSYSKQLAYIDRNRI